MSYRATTTDGTERITGRCPYGQCDESFVENSVSDVGDHFSEHLGFNLPSELAGNVAIRLMDYRRASAYGRSLTERAEQDAVADNTEEVANDDG